MAVTSESSAVRFPITTSLVGRALEQLGPFRLVVPAVRSAFILAAVATFVSAEQANAAIATQESRCAGSFCNGVVSYRGEPGENNVLTMRAAETPGEMLLFDAGAAIRGCPPFEGGVRCTNPSGVVYARLGDGDDQAVGASQVWGGAGDDRLSSAGRASGGPGNDVITEVRTIYDEDGDQPGNGV